MRLVISLLLMVSLAACSGQRPPVAQTYPAVRTGLTIPLTVHNPYRVAVEIEMKCDGLKTKWVLPGKGFVVVWVPVDATRCEIWPKVRFWR